MLRHKRKDGRRPWIRALGLCAAVCVIGFSNGTLAGTPQASAVDADSHGFAERQYRFEAAWTAASTESKDLLRAEIRRYRNVGLPALSHVDSPRLVRWTNILVGRKVGRLPGDLEQWVARLELRLTPNAVTAEALKKDPQLTARVLAPSLPPAFPGAQSPVKLQLTWVGPAGESQISRSVAVKATDFSKNGFGLYLRAPEGTDGLWHLEPSLVLGEQTLWGNPAPFGRGLAQRDSSEGSQADSPWSQCVEQLRKGGYRDMRWGGFEGLLSGTASGHAGLTMERSPDGRCLTLKSKAPCKAIVWVALPGARLLESEFLGPRLGPWKALAEKGVTVIASHEPLVATGPEAMNAARRMARETQQFDGATRILVVRGNQGRGLGLGPGDPFEGFDALVLQGPRNREAAPRAPFPGASTLFLLPSDPWDSPKVPAGQKAVASMDPPAVMAMELPRYLLENLAHLTSQVGKDKPSGGEPR